MEQKTMLINSIVTSLSSNPNFNIQQVELVQQLLNNVFMHYDCVPQKELPSVDVFDNDKIVKHFIATKRLSGCSENTIKTYRYHIYKFVDTLNVNVENVSTDMIRYYISTVSAKGNSNRYTNHIRLVLNSFFDFCEQEEYIDKNPCRRVHKIKVPKTIETTYTDIEEEKLRNACKTKREKALISFLFSTGCRREEITKIKIEDVDFQDRTVIIHGKGNKDRIVCFSERCGMYLRDYLDETKRSDVWLFCSTKTPYNQLGKQSLDHIVKKVGKNAGVDNVHLHRFRHWFCTHMISSGIAIQDVAEMVGHSSINTTRLYLDKDTERIKFEYKNKAA